MELAQRRWLQEPGARWPGLPISVGASLVALALNARPRRSVAGRLVQRLASMGAAISQRCRLLFRVRMRPSVRPGALLLYLGMDLGELLMMRKLLLGIKQRAERLAPRTAAEPSLSGA